jgi:hypothetical protein
MLEQHEENLKGLFLQTNAPLALAQLARADVEFKLTEADLLWGNKTLPVPNGYNLPQLQVSAAFIDTTKPESLPRIRGRGLNAISSRGLISKNGCGVIVRVKTLTYLRVDAALRG